MSEKFKVVTVKGREYQIGKFGAREGSFIVLKVSGIIAPMFGPLVSSLDLNKIDNLKPSDIDVKNLDIASMFGPLSTISEEDFTYLQEKCLSVCKVKLPAGYTKVLNDNCSFSIEELEDDGMAVMALMVHALVHNVMGFFSGTPLMGLFGGILATNSQA